MFRYTGTLTRPYNVQYLTADKNNIKIYFQNEESLIIIFFLKCHFKTAFSDSAVVYIQCCKKYSWITTDRSSRAQEASAVTAHEALQRGQLGGQLAHANTV